MDQPHPVIYTYKNIYNHDDIENFIHTESICYSRGSIGSRMITNEKLKKKT